MVSIDTSKECSICEIDKPLNEYYVQSKKKASGEEYLYCPPYCKKCTSKKAQEGDIDIEARRKRSAKWREKKENREANTQHKKKYRDSGKFKDWQQENKDKVKQYNADRRNKKHDITIKEWKECLDYFDNCCAYCGISQEKALETYNNRLHKEHVEHIGSNKIDNCVPACKRCNSSKHIYKLEDWYTQDNKFYSKEKLEKIYTWLHLNK